MLLEYFIMHFHHTVCISHPKNMYQVFKEDKKNKNLGWHIYTNSSCLTALLKYLRETRKQMMLDQQTGTFPSAVMFSLEAHRYYLRK